MFVPNIGALWTALKAEPDLWRKAAESNVYITDEQSLYGALKIVSLTWTQVAQTQNHEQVYKLLILKVCHYNYIRVKYY